MRAALKFQGTSRTKIPGPDGIGPLPSDAYTTGCRSCGCLDPCIHTPVSTPGKIEDSKRCRNPKGREGCQKSRQVIPSRLALELLGQDSGKASALLVSADSEATGRFHPGQYGRRAGRAAADAVGVTMAQTQQAWSRGRISGALLMDVAAAFPCVASGCLRRKNRNMELEETLVRWTDSFMRDRRVMNVGSQYGEPLEVTTGPPQG